ncbi:FAD-dependent monooxygenase [Brevibacterium oceani]|uniref:FAD-dependent monooxygenase n=1 Tax=Brevibacterium oceani TaxID=358099 RepID=UPI002811510B|nr:FAD-dependent monooxygenase [Brevibacterium oceani]
MRIAIVGAGIGGLSAAVGLQRTGAEVTVFERAPEVRAGGSGLSIFANGLAALDALGLRDEFDAVTDSSVEGFTAGQRRSDGRWIARVPNGSVGALRIVDRADLHRILLDALEPGTVRTGAEAVAARADGTLAFATGSADSAGPTAPDGPAGSTGPVGPSAPIGSTRSDHAVRTGGPLPTAEDRFDLIVGADGLHSRIRTSVAGEAVAPRYSGYSAWRGITSVPVDLDGEAGESVGHGRRFGIAPLADGRVYWFAVANMPEHASFADEKATVEQMFSRWHSPIAELIDATDAEAVARTAICDLSRPLRTYHDGRVVLLGDAAHAMTPNLGQGGGQALEDAATLSALLAPLLVHRGAGDGAERASEPSSDLGAGAKSDTGHEPDADRQPDTDPELTAALRRFDAMRRPRTQSIAKKSRLMGQLFQLENPLLAGLRDAAFAAVPGRLIAAQAASVQKWSPPAPPR